MVKSVSLSLLCLIALSPLADAQTTITVGQGGGFDYATIQAAIDAATTGDTVVVYPGTYTENIQFKGKNIALRSTGPTSPTVVAATIIDGNRRQPVVAFSGTETSSCALSGFTIRKGWGYMGGGIVGGSETVQSCALIENNVITSSAAYLGGGLAFCNGTIRGNRITDNLAGAISARGGGLYYCHGVIQDNLIADNWSEWLGGGLSDCNGTIQENSISSNSAFAGGGLAACNGVIQCNAIRYNCAERGGQGGGLCWCDGMIWNNMISENKAADLRAIFFSRGGAMADCNGTIENNTIVGNWAVGSAGGLFQCRGTIVNCIIWGNRATSGPAELDSCSNPDCCCIQDWTGGGIGNISDDPLFATGLLGPYYLSQTAAGQAGQSPCVDAGSSTAAQLNLADRTTRTDGRPDTGRVDMGYHYPMPPVSFSDVRSRRWDLYQ